MPPIPNRPYRLFNEDCLTVLPRLAPGSVDLVLADPPYGTTACKWDSVIPLDNLWRLLIFVLSPGGSVVMTATQPFTTRLISSNQKLFKYCLVWEKPNGTGFLDSKFRQIKVHEDIVVFSFAGCSNGSKPAMTYNPQMTEGKPYKVRRGEDRFIGVAGSRSQQKRIDGDYGPERYPTSVIRFKRETGLHPTQKPVGLMEYLVKTYSNEGDTVLDFSMGSGTTGVACGLTGRKFIGCENDTEHGYFETARRRIEEAYASS